MINHNKLWHDWETNTSQRGQKTVCLFVSETVNIPISYENKNAITPFRNKMDGVKKNLWQRSVEQWPTEDINQQ